MIGIPCLRKPALSSLAPQDRRTSPCPWTSLSPRPRGSGAPPALPSRSGPCSLHGRLQFHPDPSKHVFSHHVSLNTRGRLQVVQSKGSFEGPRRGGSSRGPSWDPLAWLKRLGSEVRNWNFSRIIFNLVVLYFLMRIWPMKGLNEPESVQVQVPFSEFVRRTKKGEVANVAIDGTHVSFGLKPTSELIKNRPEGSENARVNFYTVRPADYAVPYDVLEQQNVIYSAAERRGNRLVTIMVYALYIGLLLSALYRLPIKLPNQKGPGRRYVKSGNGTVGVEGESSPQVTFADIAGVDEAKEELQEIVEFLRDPERFTKLGARPPCGVLLVGPPGTGKTLLARGVAGEADVPFFSISASEFVELYVGMGAMRVRELFSTARKEAPAIVFIDEIDAVAKGRDMRLRSVGNDEREQTLNQLLTELDGFNSDKDKAVICIAATNRADVLDPALLRPGRFDRRVSVERPDRVGREQILQVHLNRRGLPLAADVSVSSLAGSTTGFTGADLANLVNEAALLAGRGGKVEVDMQDFDAAVMRALAGVEKKRSILAGAEKAVVARHEVGHALVASALARVLPLTASQGEKLSIIPRSGGALGFTYIPPRTEDRALLFDSEIRGQLAMLMGGRAAEQLTCSSISTGAVDDIRRATDLAVRAISEFGLSAHVGPVNVGVLGSGVSGGDDLMGLLGGREAGSMALLVEREVKALLEAALLVAMDVILSNPTEHEGLSHALESSEKMEGAALATWLAAIKAPASLRAFILDGTLPSAQQAHEIMSQSMCRASGSALGSPASSALPAPALSPSPPAAPSSPPPPSSSPPLAAATAAATPSSPHFPHPLTLVRSLDSSAATSTPQTPPR